MFKALFNIILNMLATVIQVVCWPINAVIVATMPDLSTKISEVTSTLSSIFNTMTWALGLLPSNLIEILLFILTVEIAKHTIFKSTHVITKVWNVLQKVKFW